MLPQEELPVTEDHIRLAEALIFASADPVAARTLAALLPEDADAETVLRALQSRYSGRGVELIEAGIGWSFRTAPDLAPRLTRIISRPRRLPRVAMETLAIIAWHQPVTRAQIEEIRGAALSQATLDALLEASLVKPAGHRDVPGRPTLWATTPAFLAQFGLKSLADLPKRSELVLEQGIRPATEPPSDAAAALHDAVGSASLGSAASDQTGENDEVPPAG
jgi:segregation and condensation protein B